MDEINLNHSGCRGCSNHREFKCEPVKDGQAGLTTEPPLPPLPDKPAEPPEHKPAPKAKQPKSLFPLEEKIKELKVNNFTKQFLTMISNLTPAIGVSEITGAFHVDSLISSPLAISSMHLTNRGTNKEHLPKLFLTALSSIGIISAQKFVTLPRILIRPVMALAVFFIEKNGSKKEHVHTENCNHDHDHDHKDKNIKKENYEITKSDWINLAKLQGQINTVPWLANLYTKRLKEMNESNDGMINKFLGSIGISALHIAGLSLGFVGLGHLIDKSLVEFKVLSDKESIAMRAEGAVCACCGAPVCVAEAASEAGVMSIAA